MGASTSHCCGPQRSSLSQDLTGAEWAVVEPMVPLAKHGGRKRTIDVREILNEIFYVLWTGCQWKALPKDLPPKSTVHDYLELWNWDGTLERAFSVLLLAAQDRVDIAQNSALHRHVGQVPVGIN